MVYDIHFKLRGLVYNCYREVIIQEGDKDFIDAAKRVVKLDFCSADKLQEIEIVSYEEAFIKACA